MTEIIGKVGSKGELYPPKKIREKIGLKPEDVIEFIVSPNGELIIRRVETIEDILELPAIEEKVSIEEIEKLSEKLQKEGVDNS